MIGSHTHAIHTWSVWLHVWIACCHHPLTSLWENHYHQNYHRRHLSLSTSKPLHFSLFPPHCRLCSPVTHLAVWFELILISSGMVGPFVQLKKPKSKHGQHGAACLWRKTEIGKRCNAEMLLFLVFLSSTHALGLKRALNHADIFFRATA